MAGGDAHVDESKLTGLSKYFNGQTTAGRANVKNFEMRCEHLNNNKNSFTFFRLLKRHMPLLDLLFYTLQ